VKFKVVLSPRAKEHLEDLENHIAEASSPRTAANYVDEILRYCASLDTFPHRGTRCDDIRPGVRMIGFRRRVTIAFEVTDCVTILGVFYGGRNIETHI
jgi:plasmid stabilization system protein ParE